MPESKTDPRLRFRIEVFTEIAQALGLDTDDARARFLGVNPSNYSRIARGITRPSQQFVAAAMRAFASDPEICFETLFEVEVGAWRLRRAQRRAAA
jgi:hypothetical protein